MPAPALQRLAGWSDENWPSFASSWDRLGQDRYMADGGRYRRRRHAVFEASGRDFVRKPHQPHFQSRDYNPLNGDVQRWFDPVESAVADSAILRSIFQRLTPLFSTLDGRNISGCWHSEMHQFRIEASPTEIGRPTPEGLHRDGVDWVLVLLISRENVDEGVTEIGGNDEQPLGRFMLRDPGDAVLLDDRRIRHGVTPIKVAFPAHPAHRDVLVVTWKFLTRSRQLSPPGI
ncbi:2OG-Fe dioxygenase family protein [Flavisphingomonas formosensis]|uniref:2OG-Fe dioxygenase family protein n=1 Tax=Flavisphingomonas formosensis TaxID=861534 RepID=UPI0038CDA8F8